MAENVVFEMRNIVKEFPGVRALDGVNFSCHEGEVHALVGENGAGKSTLMKILSGVYPYGTYSGEVHVNGKLEKFHGTRDAEEAGIGIIYQELNLVPHLSIAENMFLGREPKKGPGFVGILNWKKLYADAREQLSHLHMDYDPKLLVKDLSIGRQQIVEIAKALSLDSRILILDEPTSALTKQEVETLFEIIRLLKQKKVTMIYISHKLEEVFEICDRITVLRDGKTVGTYPKEELNSDKVVALMVGREIKDIYPKETVPISDVVLEVRNMSVEHPFLPGEKVVKGASFTLRRGEILGFAGLMGSGRSELVTAIFGAFPNDTKGEVSLEGTNVKIRSPKEAVKYGIGLVTEDRKRFGLVLSHSVGDNMVLASLDRITSLFMINKGKRKDVINTYIQSLRIKTKDEQSIVTNLSGGNQQKVVFSKWLATKPKILFLDEPTRGVDVGARVEIYQIIMELVKQGISLVIISSDLPEVLGLCDRILVMREGEIVGEFGRSVATQEKLMEAATGVKREVA